MTRIFTKKAAFFDTGLSSDHGMVTLAIGDGYNDMSMLKEASVGIQLLNPKVKLEFGDIILEDLRAVNSLFLHDGKIYFSNLTKYIIFTVSNSTIIGLQMFFFQWFAKFTASNLFTALLVILNNF